MLTTIARLFAALAGLLHVAIFVMESVLWMNPAVHRRFRVPSVEEAEKVRLFMLNQGWYNLFLALGCLVGVIVWDGLWPNVGRTLVVFTCLSMLSAAVVLFVSERKMLRAAVIQGIFPALALVLLLLRG